MYDICILTPQPFEIYPPYLSPHMHLEPAHEVALKYLFRILLGFTIGH